jgi:hypothetical protein
VLGNISLPCDLALGVFRVIGVIVLPNHNVLFRDTLQPLGVVSHIIRPDSGSFGVVESLSSQTAL